MGRGGGRERGCGRGRLEEWQIQWGERVSWEGGLDDDAVTQTFSQEDAGTGRGLGGFFVSESSLAGCEGARFFH